MRCGNKSGESRVYDTVVDRLVPLAAFTFAVATLGAAASPLPPRRLRPPSGARTAEAAKASSVTETPCPVGTLPDGDVCVHIPQEGELEEPDAPVAANAHRERSGHWSVYDQIPRRPERPADYDTYTYPVPPGIPGGHSVVSGYDLDRPDPAQRRGPTLHAVGHGGVDLPQTKGAPIVVVSLEHQQGDADVLYTGPYFGTTVMTRQTVREGGRIRDYVAIFGHMDSIAPGLAAGRTLKNGDLVGYVGDTGSPELVHLHYETRRVRDGVDILKQMARGPAWLVDDSVSIVCDPRNVLPLRETPH
jgi:murein DD-endopeptidase MepM/ murein hydrolase activator NlpD